MSAQDSGCITQLDTETLSFRWVTKSLLFLQRQTGNVVKSSNFPPQEEGPEKWHLTLKTDNEDQQYLSAYLVYLGANCVHAEVTLSIIDATEQNLNTFTAVEWFSTNSRSWGFRRFIATTALESNRPQYLQGGHLVIRCDLTVVRGYVSAPIKCEKGDDNFPEPRFFEDLGWHLDSRSHAELRVKLGGGTYHVHKPILASRSPLFRAMVSHDMFEAKEGEMFITDASYEVFRELLCFIYTGHSRNLRAMATALFAAADKYCLQRLRNKCERSLIKYLDVDNAPNALIRGGRPNPPALHRGAFDFMCAHGSEVIKTPDLATLMKHHACPEEEVLRALFGHCSNNRTACKANENLKIQVAADTMELASAWCCGCTAAQDCGAEACVVIY